MRFLTIAACWPPALDSQSPRRPGRSFLPNPASASNWTAPASSVKAIGAGPGPVVLEKELIDIKSGAGYRVIEAITRYDCTRAMPIRSSAFSRRTKTKSSARKTSRAVSFRYAPARLTTRCCAKFAAPQKQVRRAGTESQRGSQPTESCQRGLLKKEMPRPRNSR
jgi:hypothetical protein